MKFRWNILTVLAVWIMTGCTADDGDSQETVSADGNSQVEIRLASGSVGVTRSSIESDAYNNFEVSGNDGNYLSISCLSYETRESAYGAFDVDWTDATTNYNVLMSNVAATAKKVRTGNLVNGVAEIETVINWDGSYYYPQGGWYKYRFYGYYPRQTEDGVTVASERVTVHFSHLDGSQDVLYGNTRNNEALAEDVYCASYFGTHQNELPSIPFSHTMARIRFRAIASPTYNASRMIQVRNICVKNVCDEYQLVLADLNNPETEGTLEPVGSSYTTDYYLRDKVDGSNYLNGTYIIESSHTAASPRVIGDAIMVPPANSYYIQVSLTDYRGTDCSPKGFWTLAPEGGFQAGKTYWVDMNISANPELKVGDVTTD